jgi:hypothetical protein
MADENDLWVNYFFGAPARTAELKTLTISQPDFTQVWRLQSHYREGFWARLETGEQVFFQYVPMLLKPLADRGTLDFGMTVTLGDLGEILPSEIQRAREAGTLRTSPPRVEYRSYRSDNIERPMFGPITLQAPTITRTVSGAQFDATPPPVNVNKTGMLFRPDLYPMLRGFL